MVYLRSADSESSPGAGGGGGSLSHDGPRLHGHGRPRDLPWLGRRGIQVSLFLFSNYKKFSGSFCPILFSRDRFRTDWQKKCQLEKTLCHSLFCFQIALMSPFLNLFPFPDDCLRNQNHFRISSASTLRNLLGNSPDTNNGAAVKISEISVS